MNGNILWTTTRGCRCPAWRPLAMLFVVCLLFSSCGRDRVLKSIQKSGKITVITRNNSHCYYTYRDEDMGFEHDLAQAFADFLGVQLEIKVAESWGQMLPLLDKDQGHFVAASLTITPSRQQSVDFSKGYLPVQQMVITHKRNRDIKSLEDLSGKTIYVRAGTSYEERLQMLKRNGMNITIEAIDNIPTEELIEDVAERRIEITIADSNVALLNRRYYPDIRIAFPIEKPQSLGWAVKKGESGLRRKINAFFKKIEQDGTFQDIYNRYYAYVERFDHLDIKKFQERMKTRLSKYEGTIRQAASQHGFDWRLIAAIVYQESQFKPGAMSFSGVRGLMQLTLPTARDMGISDRLNPHESIHAGTKYLKRLLDAFEDASEPDRTILAIASYNVGKGHVRDAQEIAADMGLDPSKWSSVEKTLPLLRQQKYYKKSKYGYCRGTEPVFQVRRVLTYYDILKRQAVRSEAH
jgi:membrane-bound lytic murein transglycosylase F